MLALSSYLTSPAGNAIDIKKMLNSKTVVESGTVHTFIFNCKILSTNVLVENL
jgi:hypothetical protein